MFLSSLYRDIDWLKLAMILSLLSFNGAVFADTDKPMRIGLNSDRHYPPFSWSNKCDENKPLGVPLDIAGAALARLGIDYQWLVQEVGGQSTAFLFEQTGVNKLDAKMLPGLRGDDFLLRVSEPVYLMSMNVFVRVENQKSLSELSALSDRKGIYLVEKESPSFRLLRAKHADALSGLSVNGDLDEVVDLLQKGEIDYFITDRSVGRVYLVERNLTNKVVRSAVDLDVNIPLYLYISKKSPYASRVADISKELLRLNSSGESAFLMRQNMLQWLVLSRSRNCSVEY